MRTSISRPFSCLALAASLFAGQPAWAQGGNVPARVSADAIVTVDDADKVLEQVRRERQAIEDRHKREEQACQEKFFVTSCVDEADERRRAGLEAVREDEVKANAFKRRQRVVERDAGLEKKREQVEADQPKHEAQGAATQRRAAEAQSRQEAGPARPARPPSNRVAEHEAKMRQREARAQADQEKRARNVAEYEAKVRESEARQKAVAQRLLEKQKKRDAKSQSGGVMQGQ